MRQIRTFSTLLAESKQITSESRKEIEISLKDLQSNPEFDKIRKENGIPPLDPQKRKEEVEYSQKLIKALRFQLFKTSPAFGMILGMMKIIYTYQIPTFAVDNKMNLYVNPAFSSSMSVEENKGVLAHEVMHIATLTFFRQRSRDMKLWNIATDYLMNFDLIRSQFKLPSMGLIPDTDGSVHIKDHTGKTHTFNITNKTAEWLYEQMVKMPQPPPSSGGGKGQKGQQGQNPGQSQPGSGGGDKSDPNSQQQDGKGAGGSDKYAQPVSKEGKDLEGIDEHISNGESDKDKEGDKYDRSQEADAEEGSDKPNSETPTLADVKGKMRDAQNANNMKGERSEAGSKTRSSGGSGSVEDMLFRELRPTTDYKNILKNVFNRTKNYFNWRRPSRRGLAVGSFLPKNTKIEEVGDIGIAIDTSGSVSRDDVNVILNEVTRLMQAFPNVNVEIILWTGDVYYFEKVPAKNPRQVINKICSNIRSGGTLLSSVADFYTANKMKQPQAMIYFTDGYVESKPKVNKDSKNYFLVFKWGDKSTLEKANVGPVFLISIDK